jgi:hypothetical protein
VLKTRNFAPQVNTFSKYFFQQLCELFQMNEKQSFEISWMASLFAPFLALKRPGSPGLEFRDGGAP